MQLHTEVRISFAPEWSSVRIATDGQEMATVGRSAMGAGVGGILTGCQTAGQTLDGTKMSHHLSDPLKPNPGG